MSRIPFTYWHMYDYPRNLRFADCGRWFYLHSPFLEVEDEFANYYLVYELINFPSEEELDAKLQGRYFPPQEMLRRIGTVTIAELEIARMARQDLPAAPFRNFLTRYGYDSTESERQ